jgi:REP element-mobilizing transposase RayT
MSATGWRSRGYLPHCDEHSLVQHIIFGLADAMPSSVPSSITDPAKRARWADRAFDRGRGSRLLARRANATTVQESLLHGDGERYALVAWCVMPTHVHVVVEQFKDFSLAKIVHGWKSFTAHEINKNEGREGALWRREYFDRFMRSPEQFSWTVDYVERNPVAAGLVECAVDWPFSSASWRG